MLVGSPATRWVATSAYSKCRVLVLQATNFCNIDCRYCYLANRSDTAKMPASVVATLLGRLAEADLLSADMLVNWHAGEPLAVGQRHFESLLGEFEPYRDRARFHQAVQTNAMLIDAGFANVFKRHDVSVGVSIDGVAAVHDQFRVGRAGQGTHRETMRGIEHLNRAGVRFSTISVLTVQNIDRIEETVAFLREIGAASIAFNVEEVEGIHRFSSVGSIDYEATVAFWQRLIAFAAAEAAPVREIDRALLRLARAAPLSRPSSTLGAFLTIGATGEISTFSPEMLGMQAPDYGDFKLGNILDASLPEIFATERADRLAAEIGRGVARCREACEYFDYCGGGWPSNKYSEHGRFDVAETSMCVFTVKALLDAVLTMAHRPAVAGYFRSRIAAIAPDRAE